MKISIITVTFNAEMFLEKTILSVLSQSWKDFEYIIVDGASKDNTVEIIKQFELSTKNGEFVGILPEQFRWMSEPDEGLYDAMNKGIDLATGEFLWFLNAGDLMFDVNSLQTIVNAYLETPMSDIIYGQCLIIDNNGKALSERHKIAPKQLTKKSFLNGLVVCHQSMLVKKTIAPKYNLKYKICADYDWAINAVEHARHSCYIDDYISKFLIAGISSQQQKKAWVERFFIMKRAFGLCKTLMAHGIIVLKYPFVKKIPSFKKTTLRELIPKF